MEDVFIYIHVCCLNNYRDVFRHLIDCIKESGLYEIINEIRCCVLGDYDVSLFNDIKIKIIAISSDISLYEAFTINNLHNQCLLSDSNCKVLYLHTKGITKPDNLNIKTWIQYMCYFNIYQFKKCLELLDSNDTVGVNLQDKPNEECHYAGNFWWSTSSYLKNLQKCQNVNYNDPEFWLTKNKIGKYASLWHSHCFHYSELYPKENYENKPFEIYYYDYKKI